MFTKFSVIMGLFSMCTFYFLIPKDIIYLCEVEKCPRCYGNDFCSEIKNNRVRLRYDSLVAFMSNIFSIKNVFYAKYKDSNVIFKKLAHFSELDDTNFVNDNFKICNDITEELFFNKTNIKSFENLETILRVNVEPLLLELFSKDKKFPVPKLYGYCGRSILVEDSGTNLNNIENYNWYDRACVSYQLLEGVEKFTNDHEDFRLYLTDISPDNVAISTNLNATFVDLENAVILKKSENKVLNFHISYHFEEDSYSFSEEELCSHDISDHNIYSLCWLILSKNAPYPMMSGGLLHTPPQEILQKHSSLFNKIEECVRSDKLRFEIGTQIKQILKGILVQSNHCKLYI